MNRYDNFWLLHYMKSSWILSSCAVLTALIVNPVLVRACAVCVSGNDPAVDGFNWSVLFLMATPYLVVGSIAGGLFYAYRRAVAKREQMEITEPLVPLAWNEKESGR
jgi:hypothetical protein